MEDDPFEFEERLKDPLKYALKSFWNEHFWNRPRRLLVAAVILGPPGGLIVSPILAGRAAYLYAQRTGRHKHSEGLGTAFGILWLALLIGLYYVAYLFL